MNIIEGYFHTYGYLIVFAGALIEGLLVVGIIIPGALFVLLGGFFANSQLSEAGGGYSIVIVVLLAWLGMFTGDILNYLLGKSATHNRFVKTRVGQFIHSKKAKANELIQKYGVLSIYYSHFIGYLRSVIGFVAGLVEYPVKKYVIASFFASFLWALMYALIGYFLAKSSSEIKDLNNKIVYISIFMLIVFSLLRFFQHKAIALFTKYNSATGLKNHLKRMLRFKK